MADTAVKLRHWTDGHSRGGVSFHCPGCNSVHSVVTRSTTGGPVWGWNGSDEAPTFTPSVLIRSGHYVAGEAGKPCWCTFEARLGRKAPFECGVCHSFVRDGHIQFLSDCTHALAGQTVALPAIPEGK